MRIVLMDIFNQIATVKCETPVHTAEKGRVVKSRVAAKILKRLSFHQKLHPLQIAKK